MKRNIFKEGKKYTFKDYFELAYSTEDIVEALGYSYALAALELPQAQPQDRTSIHTLEENYYKVLPKISLDSEAAKREFLIAPILFEIAKETDAKIRLEYFIEVDDKLSGYLDYLIHAKQELTIIEAKKGDINKGFNQLAAELIAMDQYDEGNSSVLYGAVTIGEMWTFSVLNRETKQITKDIHNYTIPDDVEMIFKILTGIIES